MGLSLPLPSLDVTDQLAPFAVIAVAMVAVTVVVLGLVRPTDRRPPLVTQVLLAAAVIGGGSLLLIALVFVFLDSNGTTAWTWVLLAFNFMMVVPVGLWFVGQIVFRDRRVPEGGWTWPAGIGLAVTGSEVLMGLLFAVGGAAGAIGAERAFALGLSSIWFFWSMAGIMAPLVVWAPLSPLGRAGAWTLVLAAAVGPWVRSYPLIGGCAMAALMAVALVVLIRPLWTGRAVASESRLLLGLAGAFVAMTSTGLAVAATAGADAAVLAFGTTMAFVMIAEVGYLLRRSYAPGRWGAPAPAGPSFPAEAATARPGPAPGP